MMQKYELRAEWERLRNKAESVSDSLLPEAMQAIQETASYAYDMILANEEQEAIRALIFVKDVLNDRFSYERMY